LIKGKFYECVFSKQREFTNSQVYTLATLATARRQVWVKTRSKIAGGNWPGGRLNLPPWRVDRNLGCRRFVERCPDPVTTLNVDSDRYVVDLDPPEDYAALLGSSDFPKTLLRSLAVG
jgi:hypothetical protein